MSKTHTNYSSIDTNHIWHPYTQAALAPHPLFVTKAEKEFIYVLDDNGQERKIIDGVSSWWVNIHGHCHPYISSRIKEQLDKHEQVMFAGFTHGPALELVERLLPLLPRADITSDISRPRILSKAFFSDNGSTSVEVAIKMAVQFWHNQGLENKKHIVAFKDSYHGDTVGAMSTSGSAVFHEAFKQLLFPVHYISSPSPILSKPNSSLNRKSQNLVKEEAKDLAEDTAFQELTELLNRHQEDIAAIIIEPLVQGAGGMKFHRSQFLQKLRKLASDFGIILIADEVFTGFGRTGANFACSNASIVPDIICLSKALTGGFLPMGLTVTTEEIYSAFHSESPMKTFFHGHSYTANSLACTAAVASLELYEKERRLDDVKYINLMLSKALYDPVLEDLAIIRDIRVIGALGVIEFEVNDAGYLSNLAPILTKAFLDRGILLRPLGNVLYFLPPYTISVESLNYCLETIRSVIQSLIAGGL